MKKLFPVLTFLFFAVVTIAQNVGIGTTTPHSSALLELKSTNKGLLLPRVADTSSISSPAKGLVIFSTNANALFYFDGTSWKNTANSGSNDLWYKYQDSILITDKKYTIINPNSNLSNTLSGLSVTGNLVIQPSVVASATPPAIAQTLTMNNTGSLQSPPAADSVGRIFDPGGQNANYFNSMQGNIAIPFSSGQLGVALTFNDADFGLAAGDTLWIGKVSFPSCRTDYFLRLTNTSASPSTFNLIGGPTYFIFRSNGDGANSKGFDISWKKVFRDTKNVNKNLDAFGKALVFNSEDGSFQVGSPISNIGIGAACIGCFNASGRESFAAINGSARGAYSVAFWGGNAIGNNSFATGFNTTANGEYSYAFGYGAQANGNTSTAINGLAIGNFSTAIRGMAEGDEAISIGNGTNALSYRSIAIGYRNDTFPGTSKSAWIPTDPLIYFGNGVGSRSNAMVIYKNANVDINGYTRLGKLSEGAPEIKMKEITGTGPAVNGSMPVPHGVNAAKIISVQIFMEYGASPTPTKILPPGYTLVGGNEYQFEIDGINILITNKSGNSSNIGSKAFRMLITYKE